MGSINVYMVSKPADNTGNEFNDINRLLKEIPTAGDGPVSQQNPALDLQAQRAAFVVPRTFQLETITAEREVNRIPVMTLVLIDTTGRIQAQSPVDAHNFDPLAPLPQNQQQFALDDKVGWFDIGRRMAVRVTNGADNENPGELLFKGFVVAQNVQVSNDLRRYTVTIKHPAVRFTVNRRTRWHGRTANQPFNSPLKFHQYACSDWDFLVSMADLHSRWVVFDDLYTRLLKEDNAQIVEFPGNYNFKNTSVLDQIDQNNIIKIFQANNATREMEIISNGGEGITADVREKLRTRKQDKTIAVFNEVDFGNSAFPAYGEATIYTPLFRPRKATLQQEYDNPNDSLALQGLATKNFEFHQGNSQLRKEHLVKAKLFRAKYAFSHGRVRLSNKKLKDLGKYISEGEWNATQPNTPERALLTRRIALGMDILDIKERLELKNSDPKTLIRHTKVTKISHKITTDGWFIDVHWGMDPEFHMAKLPSANMPPAAGIMPAANSLQAAYVTEDSGIQNEFVSVCLFKGHQADGFNNDLTVRVPKLSLFNNPDNLVVNGNRLPYFSCRAGDTVMIGHLDGHPQDAYAIGLIASGRLPADANANNPDAQRIAMEASGNPLVPVNPGLNLMEIVLDQHEDEVDEEEEQVEEEQDEQVDENERIGQVAQLMQNYMNC